MLLRGGSPEHRFIPARAGNTLLRFASCVRGPVHPRAGGEHVSISVRCVSACGSSPRGRGTREIAERLRALDRFIPARAGNTRSNAACSTTLSVHPRAGGEHGSLSGCPGSAVGSSPRGRGTRPQSASIRSDATVHPRAGGEHPTSTSKRCWKTGSSPRGRGTRQLMLVSQIRQRFIPARAGNTSR